jgi:hypothetical protein
MWAPQRNEYGNPSTSIPDTEVAKYLHLNGMLQLKQNIHPYASIKLWFYFYIFDEATWLIFTRKIDAEGQPIWYNVQLIAYDSCKYQGLTFIRFICQ